MRLLFAWIGHSDLRSAEDTATGGVGPIAQALASDWFDQAVLLDNYPEGRSDAYVAWLHAKTAIPFVVHRVSLPSPTHFGAIYEAAVQAVTDAAAEHGPGTTLTFHLSPGTPAMAAVWLLLAKARFGAALVESSREAGLQRVDLPFDIAADFLPDLLRDADARLARQAAAGTPEKAQFGDIVYRSDTMARVVERARKAAVRSVPVLLLGESGTGKELLARAIHAASPRNKAPFVAVNCGAIPADLIEAELFGHERGAFTGAVQARVGYFEQAHGGTLFLDEIGELPLGAQVKLLRTLQEGEVRRIGATKATRVDVRLLAATHRDLLVDVAAGQFRADLFYRLAVAVLHLPPLRDRAGDLPLLLDHLWAQVQREGREDPAWTDKELSVGARKLLVQQRWRGNVRELLNTLRRVGLWTDGAVVTEADVRAAFLAPDDASSDGVLGRPLGDGFAISSVLCEVARHYLERAMADAKGNKTQAAQLLGMASYQTLTNWLKRYRIQSSLLQISDE